MLLRLVKTCLYALYSGTQKAATHPLSCGFCFGLASLVVLGVKVGVEGLDQGIGVDAVHQARLGDGLGGGVRAVEAVHAVRHEHGRDLGVELHDGCDGHIGRDHRKDLFLLGWDKSCTAIIHHHAQSGKIKCTIAASGRKERAIQTAHRQAGQNMLQSFS